MTRATHITNRDLRRSTRVRVLRRVVTSTEVTRVRLGVACGSSSATAGTVISDLIAEDATEEHIQVTRVA